MKGKILETRGAAIVFFYGLVWATVLSSADEFRAFDTYAWFHGKERVKAVRRWFVAAVIVDLVPALGLVFLYWSTWVVPANTTGPVSVACAGVASLGVFAVPRLLHAVIATRHTYGWFYKLDDWQKIPKSRREQENLVGHLLPGILYVLGFWGLAATVGWWFDP